MTHEDAQQIIQILTKFYKEWEQWRLILLFVFSFVTVASIKFIFDPRHLR